MKKETTICIILLGLLLIACLWLVKAQNTIEEQNRIIEIDQEIAEIDEAIEFHKQGYKISVEASKECEQSFLEDAEKEHIEADKKREIKAKLEEEKRGLLENR